LRKEGEGGKVSAGEKDSITLVNCEGGGVLFQKKGFFPQGGAGRGGDLRRGREGKGGVPIGEKKTWGNVTRKKKTCLRGGDRERES